MRKYSMILLVLLGIVVIVAGAFELLTETGIIAIKLNIVGSVLIVMVGLWIAVCAIECRSGYYDNSQKS